jgi:RNA polymerase sigma-70 factor (ECF subfamily)
MSGRLSPQYADELAALFKGQSAGLYRYLYLLTRGDQALAKDLVQDAFLKAVEQWGDLRQLSAEQQLGRLRVIATRDAIDVFRRNERARNPETLMKLWDSFRPRDADPYPQAVAAVAVERCWGIIQQLPEQLHLVGVLHWRLHMTSRRIADVLDTSQGTVTKQISEIRKRIRDELGPGLPWESTSRKEERDNAE